VQDGCRSIVRRQLLWVEETDDDRFPKPFLRIVFPCFPGGSEFEDFLLISHVILMLPLYCTFVDDITTSGINLVPFSTSSTVILLNQGYIGKRRKIIVQVINFIEGNDDANIAIWSDQDNSAVVMDSIRFITSASLLARNINII